METGVVVTIAIFMATAIYSAGRFSSRLERLEAWRDEQRAEHGAVLKELDEIKALLGDRRKGH